VRLVVFDIDDTLYLERDYVLSGVWAAQRASGIDGLAESCLALFGSGVRGRIFDQALRGLGLDAGPARIGALVEAYRCHQPAITLLADAASALDAWRGVAYLGIVSDGPLESQTAKARALRLDGIVDRVVLTATLGEGRGKPHPAGFILLEQAAGAAGADCVYVADNPAKDFQAPHQRGWRTIRVRRAGGLHQALASGSDVDSELATLADLNRVLSRRPRPRG
jgi:putative hydrolase of the HAD superfamily